MPEPLHAFREYGWHEVTRVPPSVIRISRQRGAPFSRSAKRKIRWFLIPMADLLKRLVHHSVERPDGPPRPGVHRLYRGIWAARVRLYISENGIEDLRKGNGMGQLEQVFRDLHENDLRHYREWLELPRAEVHASLVVDPKDINSIYLRLHAAPQEAGPKK